MSPALNLPSPDPRCRPTPPPVASVAVLTVRSSLELLGQSDFQGLRRLLADDVWLRGLLVREVHESDTADEAVEALRSWVGCPAGHRMLEASHHSLGGREFLRYRFLVRPPWAPRDWHVIEQAGFCGVRDGRIRRLDLACTGYFPADIPLDPAR